MTEPFWKVFTQIIDLNTEQMMPILVNVNCISSIVRRVSWDTRESDGKMIAMPHSGSIMYMQDGSCHYLADNIEEIYPRIGVKFDAVKDQKAAQRHAGGGPREVEEGHPEGCG